MQTSNRDPPRSPLRSRFASSPLHTLHRPAPADLGTLTLWLQARRHQRAPEGARLLDRGLVAEAGRLFVLYSGVLDALTEWIDPFVCFERLIAGSDCHE